LLLARCASGRFVRDCHQLFAINIPRLNALQPDFPPVRTDSARTQHSAVTVARLAYDLVENDAGICEIHHLPGFLIQDLCHALQNSICPAAIRHHLSVPREASILGNHAQRRQKIKHPAWHPPWANPSQRVSKWIARSTLRPRIENTVSHVLWARL